MVLKGDILMEDYEELEQTVLPKEVTKERNSNYSVSRSNIYTGVLVRGYKIERAHDDFFERREGEYYLRAYNPYRSMIFRLSENRLAMDLLYDTPEVPVLNYSDVSQVLPNRLMVDYAVNVSLLLERLGFDEYLEYEDILKFKDMLNDNLLFENINLFSESKNNKNLGLKKLLVKISFNKELKRKAESTINSSMTSYDFLKLQRTVDGNKVRVYSENGLNLFEPSSREKVKSLKQE